MLHRRHSDSKGPELRLEQRQSGSGISIMCIMNNVFECEIQCRCEHVRVTAVL